MFKNHFLFALRNLGRNKVYSLLNIAGLSVGMAVSILIGLWIYDELSFNKSFPHYSRIAQVMQHNTLNGEIVTGTAMPFPIGEELRKSFGDDFKYVTMASWNENHILGYGEKKIGRSGSFFEPGAAEMLSVKMLAGKRNGLQDPASIFLSRSLAKALFGSADPLGKVLRLDDRFDVSVTGVYEDFPFNTSFAEVGFMGTWKLFAGSRDLKNDPEPWRCNCYLSYVQIADQADMDKVSAKIRDIKRTKVHPSELTLKPRVFLQPMRKWHLFSEFRNGVNVGGRIQYVWLFGIIGLFVLLLACINFMNLSTARSEKRAREVGIRKSIGSRRLQLIFQFYVESLLMAMIAFVFSLYLVDLTLPYFSELAEKKMSILWNQPYFWLMGIGFTLFTGLVAGSYPALLLSSFKPVKALKGVFRFGPRALIPRKVLVVVQFTVSVILIIGTLFVYRQIQFARDRPVGYQQYGLINLPMITREIHDHFEAVRNELLKAGAVVSLAESGSPVTAVWSTNAGFDWKDKDPGQAVEFPNIDVSVDYGKTVGWQFHEGRDFSRDYLSDSLAFVVNETAVRFMGMKKPVGETVYWDGVPYKIIGVVRDMILESPYSGMRPTFFHLSRFPGNVVIARLNPAVTAGEALETISAVLKRYNPSQPFDYQFVDEEYARKFGNEQRIARLAGVFAILAVFISCLGLFGLASFVAEQRTREIGVRKVLGASILNLWGLLSREFVVLVLISLVIAIFAGYYFMQSWLQHYAYRTGLSWWIFAMAGAGALVITLLTVSFQAIKAAMANPVKSLRTE